MGQHMQVGQQCKVTAKCLQFFREKMLKKAPGNTKELGQMVPERNAEKNAEENTKTLQKLIKMPQPLSTLRLRPHVQV